MWESHLFGFSIVLPVTICCDCVKRDENDNHEVLWVLVSTTDEPLPRQTGLICWPRQTGDWSDVWNTHTLSLTHTHTDLDRHVLAYQSGPHWKISSGYQNSSITHTVPKQFELDSVCITLCVSAGLLISFFYVTVTQYPWAAVWSTKNFGVIRKCFFL
jgi:hypothetical protein